MALAHHLQVVIVPVPTFFLFANQEVIYLILGLMSLYWMLKIDFQLLSPSHIVSIHFSGSVGSVRRIQCC